MHCLACNVELSDFEATRRYEQSGEFVELCNHCFESIKATVEVTERWDLLSTEDVGYDED